MARKGKYPRCRYPKCDGRAYYGLVKLKPKRCSKHRNLCRIKYYYVLGKRCIVDDCRKRPSYGPRGGKPLTCKTHKEDDYINLVHKRCTVDNCMK